MVSQLKLSSRTKGWGSAFLVLLTLWFGLFKWNVLIGFGSKMDEEPIFSPNCEYYITLHQTVWERMFYSSWPYIKGTARLYTKDGKFLYQGKTDYEEKYPSWGSKEVGKGFVRMPGTDNDTVEWYYTLPSHPGDWLKPQTCPPLQ